MAFGCVRATPRLHALVHTQRARSPAPQTSQTMTCHNAVGGSCLRSRARLAAEAALFIISRQPERRVALGPWQDSGNVAWEQRTRGLAIAVCALLAVAAFRGHCIGKAGGV